MPLASKEAQTESEVLTIGEKKTTTGTSLPEVASLEPIRNAGGSSRSVQLESLKIDYAGDASSVGKLYRYTSAAEQRATSTATEALFAWHSQKCCSTCMGLMFGQRSKMGRWDGSGGRGIFHLC